MNKELRDKWVAALRSGEYTQVKEALEVAPKHCCCLGVLCRISGHDPNEYDEANDEYPNKRYYVEEELSDELNEELGLSRSDSIRLAKMNDDGVSFNAIADFIETHL